MKENQKRVYRITGLFFFGMLLFTLLSRAAYQRGTAVVSTEAPKSGTIAHSVRLSGKVIQNQDLAVTTVAGLRVAGVCVNEGQQVSQGEVLFRLDMDYLQEAILQQKQEVERQRLSVQDAKSQEAASQKRLANSRAQARESYDSAISQAETAVERAGRELDRAEENLNRFYAGASADVTETARLEEALREAESGCDLSQAALDDLTRELESAIQEALRQAESGLETPLTQEERDAIVQEVQGEYALDLSDARAALDQAQLARATAQEELEAYRQAAAQSQQSEEALLSALESAQAAYEDALSNLDRTDLSYGQAIRTADLPQGSNHAAQMGQLTYDQLVLELEKLQALWDAGGEILAPVDGVVTECSVRTGGKTSDLGAVLLADLSQGCKFSGLLSKEQAKYIGVGDQVSLRSESTGKTYDKLPVTTLSAEPEGGYRLTVQLPQNSLPLGAGADLRFTRRSQAYFCCVPLSALHLDERNQPYVLVAEPAQTVLGTQTLLRKVSVQVLEQNESLAALEPGCLHSEQQVVTASDRAVGSGSRVRVN